MDDGDEPADGEEPDPDAPAKHGSGSIYAWTATHKEKGVTLEAEGAELYVTGQSGVEAGVVVFGDLWGWNGGRTRAIADHLADSLGACVAVPRLLSNPPLEGGTDGDGLPPGFDREARAGEEKQWLMSYLWTSLEPLVKAAFGHLRAGGAKRIGGVGFCFGAWIACHASDICRDLVCGVLLFPSVHILEEIMAEEALAPRVNCPLLFLPAGDDPPTYSLGGEMFEAVKNKHPTSRTEAFPNMLHGWVTRGDAGDVGVQPLAIKEATEFAISLTTKYIRKHVWPPPPGADAETLRDAVKGGQADVVAQLLAAEVPPGGEDSHDGIGLAPIHYGAQWGHSPSIKILLEGKADVHETGGASRETPLHVSAAAGRGKATAVLLAAGAETEALDAALQTPLHHAAKNGHISVIGRLIKGRACIAPCDTAGQTPLHLAAWHGKMDAVYMLMNAEAELDPEDIRGQTPTQRATQWGHHSIAEQFEIERMRREKLLAEKEEQEEKKKPRVRNNSRFTFTKP